MVGCGLIAGLGSAAAGWLVLAALIGLAWIVEPDVGGSVAGPARLSAYAWLLAHGGNVAAGGVVIAVTPLGLTLVAGLCCWHAGAWAGRRVDVDRLRDVALIAVASTLSYVAVGVGLSLLSATADVGVSALSALPGLIALSLLAGFGGLLRAAGHGRLIHDRLPFPSRAVLSGVGVGATLLLAAGVSVVGIAIAVDRAGFSTLNDSLATDWSAGVGLFVLSLLLLPNAALYAVSVLAGPGFAVGSGTTVSAFGVSLSQVPGLPLTAALPDQPAVALGVFLGLAVPAVCGLAVGVVVARRMGDLPDPHGPLVTAGWAATAGLILAIALGLAQWAAGGSLGDGALAVVGAEPLATSVAAVGSLVLTAVAAAGLLRRRHLRNP